jgi:hypothetical protein
MASSGPGFCVASEWWFVVLLSAFFFQSQWNIGLLPPTLIKHFLRKISHPSGAPQPAFALCQAEVIAVAAAGGGDLRIGDAGQRRGPFPSIRFPVPALFVTFTTWRRRRNGS